ncbi:DUF4012 domain-containing protein [Kineococcus sp. SYSU DK002]|uniref:DUF4012 domain-containing protein n=1 Tax=Kineococcus sp. SYSU DK002 TaxID=3383123 RepID=UPI003D7E987A
MPGFPDQSPDAGPAPRAPRRTRPLRLVLALLGLLLLAWAVAVAVAGVQAGLALQRVADEVPVLETRVRAEDWTGAASTATAIADDARSADRATSTLPYRLATAVPWVGDQLGAAAGGARAAALLTDPLPRALGVVDDVLGEGLVSADRTVNVDGVRRLTPIVTDYRARIEQARSALHGAETPAVLPVLRERLDPVTAQLDAVSAPLDTAARVLPQVPALLGADDGARTYLVAFTNPAEVRPVQGIVGAYAYLSVDGGRISLTATGTDNDLYAARADVSAVGEEFAALYGQDAARVQNVTMGGSADEAGVLTSSLVTAAGLPTPDAVVFVDPVGLAQLLGEEHPPLDLGPFGAVATPDLAHVLMYEAYVTYGEDQDARKAFLAATSAAAFEAVLSDGLSTAALDGAREAVGSGHLAVWSSRPQEQEALVAAGVAGTLGEPRDAVARVGLTSTVPSKLDYWVRPSLEVSAPCSGTGTAQGSLSLTLANSVPPSVPAYVSNAAAPRVADRRTAAETVSLWVAPWVGLDQVTVDGTAVGAAVDTERGWRLVRVSVRIPPGTSVTVRWRFSGAADALPRTVVGPTTATAPTVTTGDCTP